MTNIQVLDTPAVVSKVTAAILPILGDKERADIRAVAEIQGFQQALSLIKPEDLVQIPSSEIERVAISSVATGLSWASEEGNFYLQPRNYRKIITDEKGQQREVTEKRLELSISHYGETSLRRMQGSISYIDGPHLIRQGDKISNYNPAKNTLDHEPAFPSDPNAKIIGVYEFIVLPDGTRLLKLFDESMFNRWKSASEKQNGVGNANKLYTSGPAGGIDPGFAIGKCIKHGFKGLPKCKTFGFKVESDQDTDEMPHQTVWQEVPADTPTTTDSPIPTIIPNDDTF